MIRTLKSRTFAWLAGVSLTLAAGAVFVMSGAQAQTKEPIKIGFSMALTGPLGPNGNQALLGMHIWEEETNAKGGLLGRRDLPSEEGIVLRPAGSIHTLVPEEPV